ncbi:XerC Integrase [uncultured Caudovirales phage]|uniref:Integrase n=1 Tax=uncultured Caudovirales phage TaxID=2100421 RepID=A0A6J5RVZ6_9CAUD|nr:XerC Integrase [uncultured Caudovirales phage]CAB4202741.1 XerC Integrase [uncultured Caudovirales phage]
MAYIRTIKKSDGSVSYRAEIVIKKHGEILARDSQVYSKQKLAKDWAMRREVELQENILYKKKDRLPIADLITAYLKEYPPEGRSKLFDLQQLLKTEIAKRDVYTLTARVLINHIKERNKTVAPQTAQNDLIWLKTVLQTMNATRSLDLVLSYFDDARVVLRKEGLIASSTQRDRRPTKQELWMLSRYFNDHNRTMLHIMWFAIYSCRRQSEITALRWDDINEVKHTVIVRDLKHPTVKNWQKKCKLPNGAYKIIMRQPKVSSRIFPMNSKTVSTYFTRACKLLMIDDLRFHDLRHEAVSRLFERGLSIVDVQHVSLHSNWETLKRYCNTDAGDLDI